MKDIETKNNDVKDDLSVKKFLITITIISLILIGLIPLILEYGIFRNRVESSITNGEWSSFLGSFIGSIIGSIIAGVVTIYGIKLTIEYNTKIVKQERILQFDRERLKEINNNKPFLHIANEGSGGGRQNIYCLGEKTDTIQYYFNLINIGMNSALETRCTVNYSDFNCSISKKDLFVNSRIINKSEVYKLKIAIPKEKGYKPIQINFEDILGNLYGQEIGFEYNNGELKCINNKPLIIAEQIY